MPDPSSHLQRSHHGSNGPIRDGKVLQDHPGPEDHLCLRCATRRPITRQASGRRQIRPELSSNAEFGRCTLDCRARRRGIQATKGANKARLRPERNKSYNAHAGQLLHPLTQNNGSMYSHDPQPWEDWNTTIGSVGRLLPNQTARYMSSDEKEVPAGETGELWIKGPNIFKGYLNNPEGTKNALTADGYFKTGDVGHQDKEGNFYITDRVKELIKYKGFQVPPAELEGMLASHPKVNDVAVIGVYNKEQATEEPRAYVVPAPGVEASKETAKDITDWLQAKVANHKRLRGGVRFVDEIPKSVSGKILRRVLKVRAQEEEEKGPKAKL